ncbi:6470_t:CDS:1 [Scutellospora calospora]|uniref:6470_t:CDS:1 n=1 Tax=Scutellospora calospora TaxID=85575 RepID=A0ACA9JY29_9GLOM|nr:6470_t:CDS:1 [Scutellospora calospora]
MTLLLNRIDITAILQMILNSTSIYNLKLIDPDLICNILGYYYIEQIAKTFNNQFYYKISLDEKVKNLTLHNYNIYITKQQEKHKIKDTILLDFFELKLGDMNSYISALQHVYENSLLNNYLTNSVISVIAN